MSYSKYLSFLVACILSVALSLGTAFAAGTDELTLTSSTVVDGDTNLSVLPVIELQFSGKVDDLTVTEHNKDCFHLQDGTGAVLPLMVYFPDVQVQNRLENHVFLVPQMPLAEGATYTLTVDSTVLDKKENSLENSYVMSFTTGTDESYARGAENEDLTSLGEDVLTYETALPPAVAPSEQTVETAEAQTASGASTSKVLAVAIPALILLLGAVGFWNYRSSRRSSTDA